jgi:hypothetical protein
MRENDAETVTPHEDHPSADNFETMPEVEAPKSSAREQELFSIVYDKTLDRKQAVKKRHHQAYLDLIEKRPIGGEERRALIELGREYTGILQQLIDAVEIPGVSKGDTYAKLDAYAEIKGIAYTDRQNYNYAEAAPRAVIQDILKRGPNLDERRTRADFVRHVAQEIAAFEQAAQKQSAPSMEKVKATAPPQAATTPANGTAQRQSVLDAAEEAQRLDAQGGPKRSAAAMAADERLAETIRNLISNEYQGVEDVTRSDKPRRQWTVKERELNSLIDRLETLQSAKKRTRSMTAATAQSIRETTRSRLIDEMRRRIETDSRIKPTTSRDQLIETAREVTQGADNFETMPPQPTRTAHTIVLDRLISAKRSGDEAQEAQVNEQLRPQLLSLLERLEQGTLDDGERQALLSRYQELETLTTGAGKELAQEIVRRLRGADNFETISDEHKEFIQNKTREFSRELIYGLIYETTKRGKIKNLRGRLSGDAENALRKMALSALRGEDLIHVSLKRVIISDIANENRRGRLSALLSVGDTVEDKQDTLYKQALIEVADHIDEGAQRLADYGSYSEAEHRAVKQRTAYLRALSAEIEIKDTQPAPDPSPARAQLAETVRSNQGAERRRKEALIRLRFRQLLALQDQETTETLDIEENKLNELATELLNATDKVKQQEIESQIQSLLTTARAKIDRAKEQSPEARAAAPTAVDIMALRDPEIEKVKSYIRGYNSERYKGAHRENYAKEIGSLLSTVIATHWEDFTERYSEQGTLELLKELDNGTSPLIYSLLDQEQPAPDPSPARAQLAETVREISEPASSAAVRSTPKPSEATLRGSGELSGADRANLQDRAQFLSRMPEDTTKTGRRSKRQKSRDQELLLIHRRLHEDASARLGPTAPRLADFSQFVKLQGIDLPDRAQTRADFRTGIMSSIEELRSATTVQKSLSAPKLTKMITYRAQLLQTIERIA